MLPTVVGEMLPTVVAQSQTELEGALSELSRVSAMDWLVAGVIILISVLSAYGLMRLTRRAPTPRTGPLVAKLIGRLLVALMLADGLIYALAQINVSVGPLLGLLGLLGLAVALSSQEVLGNLIAGVMLSLNRSFRIDDEIATGGYEGTIEDVSLRSVTLRAFDGARVFLPNSTVWSEAIVNYTTLGARRTDLHVGVSYAPISTRPGSCSSTLWPRCGAFVPIQPRRP